MLHSPSYESDISFQTSVASRDELQIVGEDWGVVSHNGSEMDYVSSGPEGSTGVLILDGEESEEKSVNEQSELSVPGIDSVPSEIESISGAENTGSHTTDNVHANDAWLIGRRSAIFGVVTVVCLSLGTLGVHLHHRKQWHSAALEKEQEIQRLLSENERLAREKEELKVAFDERPAWDDQNQDFFTIADNCWLKAKGHVKLGECAEKAKEAPKSWFESVLGSVGETLDGAFGGSAWDEHDCENAETDTQECESRPLVLREAFESAGKSLASEVEAFRHTISESGEFAMEGLSQTSEAMSGALKTVSEAMAFELKELTDDPLKYFAAAVKSASHTPESAGTPSHGNFDNPNPVN